MIRFLKTRSLCRTLQTAALLLPLMGAAATQTVVAVQDVRPERLADIVVLDAGYSAGLRQGMVCRVKRGSVEIAEVIVVNLRFDCSAAMIMGLSPGTAIRAGDEVEIKLLKS